MRIFSEKSFQFDHPAGQEPAVVVQSQSFADVPDWVSQSLMFKLASQNEEVTVVENKKDEKKAETGGKGKKDAEKKAEEKALKEAEATEEDGQQQ
ncbi:hypothetical protein [Brevibacillus laterosporus]|uniref:hypothetical protein n=1 Tax=Brevibacillus laterosporus TaxID=1465 RepID=UPI0018F87B93|nr:hypothetical protein [Brevibacillus laterosporus]MBG9773564.1 hypothetical protein [Brevibacillus laterosporus]